MSFTAQWLCGLGLHDKQPSNNKTCLSVFPFCLRCDIFFLSLMTGSCAILFFVFSLSWNWLRSHLRKRRASPERLKRDEISAWDTKNCSMSISWGKSDSVSVATRVRGWETKYLSNSDACSFLQKRDYQNKSQPEEDSQSLGERHWNHAVALARNFLRWASKK